jgi:hypothetical protein
MMLERQLQLKAVLRELAVDPSYENCNSFDADFQRTVLSDEFWGHVSKAVQLMKPVYAFLRYVDSNEADFGELYNRIRKIGIEIQSVESNDAATAHELFLERLNGLNRKVPFHSAAHTAAMMLSPKNWDLNLAEKFGADFNKRRMEFIEILMKVSKTETDADNALAQFDAVYKTKQLGLFQLPVVQKTAAKISPVTWWQSNGCELPELRYVAIRVLALACSNSSAERNWSIHGFIHSKLRNRLAFDTQTKLVNVYVNLKLQAKLQKQGCQTLFQEEAEEDTVEDHVDILAVFNELD